jgi:hypothetical protein
MEDSSAARRATAKLPVRPAGTGEVSRRKNNRIFLRINPRKIRDFRKKIRFRYGVAEHKEDLARLLRLPRGCRAGGESMHLTDAGPVSTGAPSVVQEEARGGNNLTRKKGDGFADTCALLPMVNFLKSCRPSRPGLPVRPGSQGDGITLVRPLSVAVPQLVSSTGHSIQSGTVLPW